MPVRKIGKDYDPAAEPAAKAILKAYSDGKLTKKAAEEKAKSEGVFTSSFQIYLNKRQYPGDSLSDSDAQLLRDAIDATFSESGTKVIQGKIAEHEAAMNKASTPKEKEHFKKQINELKKMMTKDAEVKCPKCNKMLEGGKSSDRLRGHLMTEHSMSTEEANKIAGKDAAKEEVKVYEITQEYLENRYKRAFPLAEVQHIKRFVKNGGKLSGAVKSKDSAGKDAKEMSPKQAVQAAKDKADSTLNRYHKTLGTHGEDHIEFKAADQAHREALDGLRSAHKAMKSAEDAIDSTPSQKEFNNYVTKLIGSSKNTNIESLLLNVRNKFNIDEHVANKMLKAGHWY